MQPSPSPDWRRSLRRAVDLWQDYQFEAAVQQCLADLHQVLDAPASRGVPSSRSCADLVIVIACGGRGSRWGDFLGRPKHLVDPGEGVPLLQRTLIQLSDHFPGARLCLLLGEEHLAQFADLQPVEILLRRSAPDALVALEVLERQAHVFDTGSRLLWLHGDVYFSESALQIISDQLALQHDEPKWFGRKWRNQSYWNDDGEIFACYVPQGSRGILRDWCQLTRQVYIASVMKRLSAWEVISLMSYARQGGYLSAAELVRSGKPPMDVMRGVLDYFSRRDFAQDLWVEIDDETEDFDFPFEYFRRLVLRARTVGMQLDARLG